MKKSIVRITTAIWAIGLVLTWGVLSVPPANVPLYIGLACIAMIPLILGSGRYRIFGIAAVAVSLVLICLEYEAGLRIKAQMEHFRQKLAEQQATGLSTALQNTNQ